MVGNRKKEKKSMCIYLRQIWENREIKVMNEKKMNVKCKEWRHARNRKKTQAKKKKDRERKSEKWVRKRKENRKERKTRKRQIKGENQIRKVGKAKEKETNI